MLHPMLLVGFYLRIVKSVNYVRGRLKPPLMVCRGENKHSSDMQVLHLFTLHLSELPGDLHSGFPAMQALLP